MSQVVSQGVSTGPVPPQQRAGAWTSAEVPHRCIYSSGILKSDFSWLCWQVPSEALLGHNGQYFHFMRVHK